MAYVAAVTDRTLSDIQTPTSKGHWNVADWARVYRNSQLVNSLAAIMLETSIAFDSLTAPTITTIPAVADFNLFVGNIERTRLAVAAESIAGTTTEIKDDYLAGPGMDAPDYTDANLWESTLDAIWEHFDGPALTPFFECPTLSSNLTISTDNTFTYIDCLNLANFNLEIQGNSEVHII